MVEILVSSSSLSKVIIIANYAIYKSKLYESSNFSSIMEFIISNF